ncbi:DNA polymerase III subunit epsilon [Niabella ginsenosidivorans]|uniref:DNA polymerase III subunit epsilon n=1 Tax=Niabella ginsenosidivorans TaxID=1176587 RepID=A0A1A9HYW7_9BACT|nr:exonuclease domain-containing protein [Niabella ginsenosidivorans]ANH80576.1 DNA polymerase III subunit epsilon [Niabella ginsenosidivorans]
MHYAIVDIETTGAYAAAGSITEICIQVLDEAGTIVERFESLVNPVQQIPYSIQALTGITNEMVQEAPLFEEIAEQVYTLLLDKVFVAHSVNFDYSFVKNQLSYCGFELNVKKLCTVRLSRKIIPAHRSYSLGKLCEALGIRHVNKHRAGGDTDATVALFRLLLEKDTEGHIAKSLKKTSKEQVLPPNVPKSDFDQLPYTPGIYYFHDEKGRIVYVGKAKNIRYRVSSHFSNNSTSRQRQNFMRHVYRISFEECGTELMAAVKESTEIKRWWPRFNSSQKRREDLYGIVAYEDQNGYLRLGVEKMSRGRQLLNSYHHIEGAKAALRQLVHDFNLCPRLCFIGEELFDEQLHRALCAGACIKKEAPEVYNRRIAAAMEHLKNLPSFAIIDKGIHHDEKSCILVWNGSFYGMGFIAGDVRIEQPEQFREYVTPYKENSAITNMLFAYAKRYPSKIIQFNKVV